MPPTIYPPESPIRTSTARTRTVIFLPMFIVVFHPGTCWVGATTSAITRLSTTVALAICRWDYIILCQDGQSYGTCRYVTRPQIAQRQTKEYPPSSVASRTPSRLAGFPSVNRWLSDDL